VSEKHIYVCPAQFSVENEKMSQFFFSKFTADLKKILLISWMYVADVFGSVISCVLLQCIAVLISKFCVALCCMLLGV